MHFPQKTLNEVLEDWTTADIPEKTRGALRLLEYMTTHPQDIDQALLKDLRSDGLDTLAIQEAANVGFHYNLIDRVADAFEFPVPQGVQQERLARMLNLTGKFLRGAPARESWIRSADGRIRPPEVEKGREHLLEIEGTTEPDLRRAVEAYVTAQWGWERRHSGDLPPELEIYLRKLALHAYRILDEDVESLQKQGYTDNLIYEITLVGAVGAALVGLEAVYQHLYA